MEIDTFQIKLKAEYSEDRDDSVHYSGELNVKMSKCEYEGSLKSS